MTTGGGQGCRVMAEVEQWQALWEAQMGTSHLQTLNDMLNIFPRLRTFINQEEYDILTSTKCQIVHKNLILAYLGTISEALFSMKIPFTVIKLHIICFLLFFFTLALN